MSSAKEDLLLFFDRPKEPVFMPKGDDKAIFEQPQKFLQDRYKPVGVEIFNRFGEQSKRRIPVKDIALPDISLVMELSRYENFSLFIPKHADCAARLTDIFMGLSNLEDLKAMACYARDRVNPYLFNYAYSVALLHRPDTNDLDIPSFNTCFPDKYLDGVTLQKAREESETIPREKRSPIVIPKDYTASDLESEHRLAYFREDLGVNLHHWHWHLVYPIRGPENVVKKNRRGELFYYMHHQIIARYNTERLCNLLPRAERLNDWRKPIPEAYFPKLNSLVSNKGWPSRVANQKFQDLRREDEDLKVDIDDLQRWRDRVFSAIHAGSVLGRNNEQIPLNESDGIDMLGNMVEPCPLLSPNPGYYGSLHNTGHDFIGYVHDPDKRFKEDVSVMGDTATAMRDPVFYRWHSFIDDVFDEYKQTLPPYTAPQLNYRDVNVTNVSVDVEGGKPNEFSTFWMQSDMNMSRGLDFTADGAVFIRFTHLNHRPFTYRITVDNKGRERMGTCRIFMGPKVDEAGKPWLFRDQRLLMIEMDRFPVNLKSGMNKISRRSTESSVTIPFERTFRDLKARPSLDQPGARAIYNFCGCGWPEHMLVPRGTGDGYKCDLFVMISNYEDDRIDQTVEGQCNDAYSFCGIKDKLYPDKRPMGFPFDRMAPQTVSTMSEFLTPNMRVQDVTILFNDQVVVNPLNPK